MNILKVKDLLTGYGDNWNVEIQVLDDDNKPHTYHFKTVGIDSNLDNTLVVYGEEEFGKELKPKSTEMHIYDIWSEGYLCSGMEGIPARAQLIASGVKGYDFLDACERWFNSVKDAESKYGSLSISRKTNTADLWGCRLFDNETDARKNFG